MPLWEILGRQTLPWEFGALDFVAVAGTCGCILVRRKRWAVGKLKAGMKYECSVCHQQGGRNGQEVLLLKHVKDVLQARADPFVICSQMPLEGTRCDAVVVPLHATSVNQLAVFELDGTDHFDKPRRYGMSMADAYNATVDRDNEKAKLVTDLGMQFARIAISESVEQRTKRLSAVLDRL